MPGHARFGVPVFRPALSRTRAGLKAGTPACLALAILVLFLAFPASALTFPALTGRVVDRAGIIPETLRATLSRDLAALERETSIQFVLVTVTSLEGTDIAGYTTQLANRWGIGQAGLDNGVVLLVAPSERKVRIAVGKGLQSILTDAVTQSIIDGTILPRFRAGDLPGGIREGATAVSTTLRRASARSPARAGAALAGSPAGLLVLRSAISIFSPVWASLAVCL